MTFFLFYTDQYNFNLLTVVKTLEEDYIRLIHLFAGKEQQLPTNIEILFR